MQSVDAVECLSEVALADLRVRGLALDPPEQLPGVDSLEQLRAVASCEAPEFAAVAARQRNEIALALRRILRDE